MNLDPNYFDDLGLPVTKGGDGGDSCAEAGTIAALSKNVGINAGLVMYVPDRGPVRHPDYTKWYGQAGRFSRDQLIAFLCGLCMQRRKYVIKKLFKLHLKHALLLAWNVKRNFVYDLEADHVAKSTPDVPWNPEDKTPDFTGPEVWALWIRTFRAWYLYPLLIILDLETLFGSIHWLWRKDRLTRNHLLAVYVSTKVLPTPTSWLARLITPITKLIDKWEGHCNDTGAINTAPLFRRAYGKPIKE